MTTASNSAHTDALVAAGLGLGKHELRLARSTAAWLTAGGSLRDHLTALLGAIAAGVEHIGSTSVEGLLAKPIVDLAVGSTSHESTDAIRDALEAERWISRGDSGEQGGHLLVLEARPRHRVAHLHVVEHDGIQWNNYLRLRSTLRSDQHARNSYEATKLRLIDEVGVDREAYTDGKTEIIRSILHSSGPSARR